MNSYEIFRKRKQLRVAFTLHNLISNKPLRIDIISYKNSYKKEELRVPSKIPSRTSQEVFYIEGTSPYKRFQG